MQLVFFGVKQCGGNRTYIYVYIIYCTLAMFFSFPHPRAALAVGEVARRLEGDEQLRISAAGFAAAKVHSTFLMGLFGPRS